MAGADMHPFLADLAEGKFDANLRLLRAAIEARQDEVNRRQQVVASLNRQRQFDEDLAAGDPHALAVVGENVWWKQIASNAIEVDGVRYQVKSGGGRTPDLQVRVPAASVSAAYTGYRDPGGDVVLWFQTNVSGAWYASRIRAVTGPPEV